MARKYLRYCASGSVSLADLATAMTHPKRPLSGFAPPGAPTVQHRILLDTLDWRFDAKGWLLEARISSIGATAVLSNQRGTSFSGSLHGPWLKQQSIPTCLSLTDVEPEALTSRITEIALERAVVGICSLEVITLELEHLDPLDRVDASVEIARIDSSAETWISIFADSIDEDLHDHIAKWFKDRIRSLWEVEAGHDYYDSALATLRRRRGDFAVKTAISPRPGEHLTESLAAFLSKSWSNFSLAYATTKLDCDEESLHDLRVILRTTRAVLEPIVAKYKGGILKELLAETKLLAASTNKARDLDVIVANLLARNPEPELSALLEKLQAGVRNELRLAISKDLSKLERLWHGAIAFLIAGSQGVYKKSSHKDNFLQDKTVDFIKSATEAQKLICLHGVDTIATQSDPSPADLHQLRKDFKRLRYLLESFSVPRSPREERDITEAKNLQTQLGLFQDAEVRMEFVIQLAAEHHDELIGTLGPRLIADAVAQRRDAQDNAVATLRELAKTPGWKATGGKH